MPLMNEEEISDPQLLEAVEAAKKAYAEPAAPARPVPQPVTVNRRRRRRYEVAAAFEVCPKRVAKAVRRKQPWALYWMGGLK